MLAKITMETSTGSGITPPKLIIQNIAARPPNRAWPSAPQFQNFILKAGVTARDRHRRMAASCRNFHSWVIFPSNRRPNTLRYIRSITSP